MVLTQFSVEKLGITGDQHGEPFHGGRTRAILHYAAENYEALKSHFEGFVTPGFYILRLQSSIVSQVGLERIFLRLATWMRPTSVLVTNIGLVSRRNRPFLRIVGWILFAPSSPTPEAVLQIEPQVPRRKSCKDHPRQRDVWLVLRSRGGRRIVERYAHLYYASKFLQAPNSNSSQDHIQASPWAKSTILLIPRSLCRFYRNWWTTQFLMRSGRIPVERGFLPKEKYRLVGAKARSQAYLWQTAPACAEESSSTLRQMRTSTITVLQNCKVY